MTDTVINPQDYVLNYATVFTSSSNYIELKHLIIEFNYYEDIFTNNITGNIVVNDSGDLLTLFSFSGNEYFVFSVDKPGLNSPIEKVARIYSVTKRTLTKDTNENYILNFCSEEMLLSEQYRVSKSYKNKKVSQVVEDICTSYLKINPKKLGTGSIEETSNVLDLIVPNLKPFEAINWLCTYAQSATSQTKSSTYLFFENRDGFNFKSLQSLYDGAVYASYYYEPKNLVSPIDNRIKDLDADMRNALTYTIINQFNSLSSIAEGAFANKLLTVDLINQSYDKSIFDYASYFTQSKKLNSSGLLTNSQNRFGKAMNETPEGALRLVSSIKKQSKNEYVLGKGQQIKDIDIENFIPYRMAQLSHISTIRLKLTVPGDVLLKVGQVIIFNLPHVNEDRQTGKTLDELYSGKYLITAVRHKTDQTGVFQTTLEICKESLPNPYMQFNNSSSLLSKLRSE